MNRKNKNKGLFYLFFHFSTDNQNPSNDAEKENFGLEKKRLLRVENINARLLLDFFQPIHKGIKIIKNLKLINMILIIHNVQVKTFLLQFFYGTALHFRVVHFELLQRVDVLDGRQIIH